MYTNSSAAEPPPESYEARWSVRPVSSSICGDPVTCTSSLNETVMLISEPTPYVPSALRDETESTRGRSVSIRMAAAASVGSPASASGRARTAGLPGVSVIVPLVTDRAFVPL